MAKKKFQFLSPGGKLKPFLSIWLCKSVGMSVLKGLFWQKMNVILHQTNEKYNFTKKSEKYSFFFLENLEIKKQTCIFAIPNIKGSRFSISKLGV